MIEYLSVKYTNLVFRLKLCYKLVTLLSGYVPKPNCLEKNKKRKSLSFERKSLWWNSVLIMLQSFSTQPSALSKTQSSWKTFL